ncbi:hypothetical protein Avbf_08381 [Armadillidium vulgare]|nr:hypothetical protein Avbf_08381 [Armadillidium vulgare]
MKMEPMQLKLMSFVQIIRINLIIHFLSFLQCDDTVSDPQYFGSCSPLPPAYTNCSCSSNTQCMEDANNPAVVDAKESLELAHFIWLPIVVLSMRTPGIRNSNLETELPSFFSSIGVSYFPLSLQSY